MSDRARLKFDGERMSYTVQAGNDRYLVCTKPFNLKKTYYYTIVDVQEMRRGAINLILGLPMDVDSPEKAADLLGEMQANPEWGVSHRNSINLTERELAECMAVVGGFVPRTLAEIKKENGK
jgi:hypothetical protein